MSSLLLIATILAALGSGLIAGFFFAFSACVMEALRRLEPSAGIAAMQSINIVVLNPLFLGAFFGTALLSLVLAVVAALTWSAPGAVYLLAGSLLYLAGAILVTIVFNVPLNNRLAAVKPDSADGRKVGRSTSPPGRTGTTSARQRRCSPLRISSSRPPCVGARRGRPR